MVYRLATYILCFLTFTLSPLWFQKKFFIYVVTLDYEYKNVLYGRNVRLLCFNLSPWFLIYFVRIYEQQTFGSDTFDDITSEMMLTNKSMQTCNVIECNKYHRKIVQGFIIF